ncbi:MAG: MFS transporter [Cytophagales bacterium]|nr:MAG: MFS transporter [Cytophagales bacterium]
MNNNQDQEKNKPSVLNAWASYDWANSAYNLAITVAIFPIYYQAATATAFGGDKVQFFGLNITGSVLYEYAISFSFLLAAILSPILSGIADYGGSKKFFMKFFTYLGATACLLLFFFTGNNIELGIIAAVFASLGYAGAIVFYISFLPEIATEDRFDNLSAKGFSLGFLGSLIHLVISLVLITYHEAIGISQGIATRLSFLFVGLWWIGFAQIAFRYLKVTHKKSTAENTSPEFTQKQLLQKGFLEIYKVYKQVKTMRYTKRFLFAFFCYNMGAQTIMLLASIFGSKELHMDSGKLILTILLLQVVGIFGAQIFAFISDKKGNKFSLMLMLCIWLVICMGGYFVYNETAFYVLASAVGLVMGGIHLSRSTYAKLIPMGTPDTTSFFSFYDVMDKVATALGLFVYGIVEHITGNLRYSVLALGLFFIVGIIIMTTVKIESATVEKK